MKEEFSFKKSWADALAELPERARLQVYNAIIQYCLTGIVIELKSVAKGAFAVIKYDIDSAEKKDSERQQSLSEKRSEAAKKSVAARKQKAERETVMAEEKTVMAEEKTVMAEGEAVMAKGETAVPMKEVVMAENKANEAKSANARLAEFAKKYNLSDEYVCEIKNIYNINNNNQDKETHKKEKTCHGQKVACPVDDDDGLVRESVPRKRIWFGAS